MTEVPDSKGRAVRESDWIKVTISNASVCSVKVDWSRPVRASF